MDQNTAAYATRSKNLKNSVPVRVGINLDYGNYVFKATTVDETTTRKYSTTTELEQTTTLDGRTTVAQDKVFQAENSFGLALSMSLVLNQLMLFF